MIALLLLACQAFRDVDPDSPCREAGYAIARRTELCTEDTDLANARFDVFEADYRCIPMDVLNPAEGAAPEDLYACAFTIDRLPCEVVLDLGDDLDAWLASASACAYVVEPA